MAIYKLGDVSKIKMCKRVTLNQTNKNNGVPFFTIGTLGKDADRFIDEELWNILTENYSYPTKGTPLITASGTIGKVVRFNGEKSYFQDSNIVWMESDFLKQDYIYYWLMKSPFLPTHGSTIKRLYNSDIRATKIFVPSLEEQQEIIDIIKPIEECINNVKKQIEALKRVLINNYNLCEAERTTFNSIVQLINKKYDNQSMYLATNAIGEFGLDIDKAQDVSLKRPSRANLTPEKNSVIFSKLYGENKVLYIDDTFEYVVSTGFFNIRTEYLDHVVGFLLSNDFDNQKNQLSTGTTMVGINNEALKKVMLTKPRNNSSEIVKMLSKLLNLELKLKQNLDKCIELLIK